MGGTTEAKPFVPRNRKLFRRTEGFFVIYKDPVFGRRMTDERANSCSAVYRTIT